MERIRGQLNKLPLCAICAVGVCVLHVAHAFIHHTPLDSGALDASINQLTVAMSANVNTRP